MRLSVAALFAAPVLLTCASVSTSAQSRVQTAEAERLQRDVAWLADDVREGRRAGTSKALEAADFIAKRFRALGLEPAGSVGFLQEFDVPLEARDGGRSEIAASARKDGALDANTKWNMQLSAGTDLVPLFCSDGGPAKGDAAFVAFAIDDAARGRDDFANVTLTGKIAVMVRGVPKTAPQKPQSAPSDAAGATTPAVAPHDTATVAKGDGWGGGGLIFTKVMNAKRRGAVGVILLPSADDEAAALLAFGEGGTARAGIPCAMITWKGARILFGDATVDAWRGGLETASAAPVIQATYTIDLKSDVLRERGPARNVLAKLRGADGSRTVVVGAHYDHLGMGGHGSLAAGAHAIHNGADDNASGTAAVLEMARILSTGPRPACDVVFALWSGEELGLLGSDFWCEHPTVELAGVSANLNLDMVGRADSNKLQVLAAGTATPFASWMDEVGKNAGLELVVSTSSNMMGGSSDHATFLKRKIPALHLFSGLHADYHKPSDDTERFEAPGTAKVTNLSVDLVRRLCAAGKLAYVEPKVDPNAKVIQSGFRSWFGSIPNYAWDKGGVMIDGTSAGSPAEHAGFLKGDVLIGIGDIKVTTIDDFMFALQTYKPGDVVLVKFTRDGKDQETRVTLSTRGQQ
ncbi:MAG: M28 family peptidase [Planctomycetota bacterium]|nr:M28 family peptidase [Planctomycetota bacterium]